MNEDDHIQQRIGREAYLEVFDPEHPGVSDWPSIDEEMRAVLDARSDRKAGAVIRWWGGWGLWQPFRSPTAAARELRRVMREKLKG